MENNNVAGIHILNLTIKFICAIVFKVFKLDKAIKIYFKEFIFIKRKKFNIKRMVKS